jgi:hypothetical protein
LPRRVAQGQTVKEHARRGEESRDGAVRLVVRWLQRLGVLALGIVGVWLIVFVFRVTDQRLPTVLALGATYALAAYVVLPRVVRMSVKILKRKSVPSFTLTGDGLLGDPVNLVLLGAFGKLQGVFARAGWTEADTLGLGSSWRMVVAFVLNRPYPAGPFSTLYLFGRGQDVGFQKPIGGSPRKRHHIRFWGLSLERAEATLNTPAFWLNTTGRPLIGPRYGSAPGRATPAFRSPSSPSRSPTRPIPTPTRNETSSSAS